MDRRDPLARMVRGMSRDEVAIIWRFAGFSGPPPQDEDRLVCTMFRGITKAGRRSVARAWARAFAAVPSRVLAALALLLSLVPRPAGVVIPVSAPYVLTPQRRSARITPTRAP